MAHSANPPPSPWSLRIATVAGIPVRIHFTFFFLLVWVAVFPRPGGPAQTLALVLGVFLCVVLHEFGHALMARRFGIETRDITLYPIGGVASIKGRPKPIPELWIAIAGPVVNVLILFVLTPVLVLTQDLNTEAIARGNFTLLQGLWVANVMLVAFNMLPAFPMDGGRVLRAALSIRMGSDRATQLAAAVGQGFAVLFGLVGIFTGQLVLVLVAFFVFLGASQEAAATSNLSVVEGRRVSEAMITRVATISNGLTLNSAAQMLIQGYQQDFPVVMGEEVLGVLTRQGLAQGLSKSGPTAYVAEHMDRNLKVLPPHEPLERVFELMQNDRTPVLVMADGRLIGMVTAENLSEFIMLEHARGKAPRPRY